MVTPARSVDYGLLVASRYDFDFARKWALAAGRETGELRGAPELKPMIEVAHIYSNMRELHLVPFRWRSITRLAATAPLLPLLLTMSSPSEALKVLLRISF